MSFLIADVDFDAMMTGSSWPEADRDIFLSSVKPRVGIRYLITC
jgi:hypothetical protein